MISSPGFHAFRSTARCKRLSTPFVASSDLMNKQAPSIAKKATYRLQAFETVAVDFGHCE